MNDDMFTNAKNAAHDRRMHALASLNAFVEIDALHERMKVREAEIHREIAADESVKIYERENEFRNRIFEDAQLGEDINSLAKLKVHALAEKIEAEYSHDLHETYCTFTKAEVG